MVETHLIQGGKSHNIIPMRRTFTGFECNQCGSTINAIEKLKHNASCFGDRVVEDWTIAEEAE